MSRASAAVWQALRPTPGWLEALLEKLLPQRRRVAPHQVAAIPQERAFWLRLAHAVVPRSGGGVLATPPDRLRESTTFAGVAAAPVAQRLAATFYPWLERRPDDPDLSVAWTIPGTCGLAWLLLLQTFYDSRQSPETLLKVLRDAAGMSAFRTVFGSGPGAPPGDLVLMHLLTEDLVSYACQSLWRGRPPTLAETRLGRYRLGGWRDRRFIHEYLCLRQAAATSGDQLFAGLDPAPAGADTWLAVVAAIVRQSPLTRLVYADILDLDATSSDVPDKPHKPWRCCGYCAVFAPFAETVTLGDAEVDPDSDDARYSGDAEVDPGSDNARYYWQANLAHSIFAAFASPDWTLGLWHRCRNAPAAAHIKPEERHAHLAGRSERVRDLQKAAVCARPGVYGRAFMCPHARCAQLIFLTRLAQRAVEIGLSRDASDFGEEFLREGAGGASDENSLLAALDSTTNTRRAQDVERDLFAVSETSYGVCAKTVVGWLAPQPYPQYEPDPVEAERRERAWAAHMPRPLGLYPKSGWHAAACAILRLSRDGALDLFDRVDLDEAAKALATDHGLSLHDARAILKDFGGRELYVPLPEPASPTLSVRRHLVFLDDALRPPGSGAAAFTRVN